MKNLFTKKNRLLFITLIILMIISFLTMYNCRYVSKIYANYLSKQFIWYILFFLILILFSKEKLFFKYSFLLYFFNVLLLLLVLLFGKEVNGAKAWFDFGIISFQPSELMKLTYSLYLTNLLANYKYRNLKKEFLFLLKIFLIFLIPSILIFLEPDTGAIIFLFIITITSLLISNIKKRWFIILSIIIFLSLIAFLVLFSFKQDLLIKLIGTSFFYRMDRIINFGTTNNMQLENALISIGNSGIFGIGLNNAAIYIPEAATDFAISIFISTFGFLGTIVLIICYFLNDLFFLNIIFKSKNKTTKIFTSGFVAMFIFTQIYNIFMNIGLLPIMGIPLPFLSYGGSSLIVLGLYIAIILKLNINMV